MLRDIGPNDLGVLKLSEDSFLRLLKLVPRVHVSRGTTLKLRSIPFEMITYHWIMIDIYPAVCENYIEPGPSGRPAAYIAAPKPRLQNLGTPRVCCHERITCCAVNDEGRVQARFDTHVDLAVY